MKTRLAAARRRAFFLVLAAPGLLALAPARPIPFDASAAAGAAPAQRWLAGAPPRNRFVAARFNRTGRAVNAVPAPRTWTLLGLWLGAAGWGWRRGRRAAARRAGL